MKTRSPAIEALVPIPCSQNRRRGALVHIKTIHPPKLPKAIVMLHVTHKFVTITHVFQLSPMLQNYLD